MLFVIMFAFSHTVLACVDSEKTDITNTTQLEQTFHNDSHQLNRNHEDCDNECCNGFCDCKASSSPSHFLTDSSSSNSVSTSTYLNEMLKNNLGMLLVRSVFRPPKDR